MPSVLRRQKGPAAPCANGGIDRRLRSLGLARFLQDVQSKAGDSVDDSSPAKPAAVDLKASASNSTETAVAAPARVPEPKRRRRPLTAHNLFFRFKRQRILDALASDSTIDADAIAAIVAAPPGSEAVAQDEAVTDELRGATIRKDLEGNLLPRDSRRRHRSALNGAISFLDFGKLINAAWKACDDYSRSVFAELYEEGQDLYWERLREYHDTMGEAPGDPAPAPAAGSAPLGQQGEMVQAAAQHAAARHAGELISAAAEKKGEKRKRKGGKGGKGGKRKCMSTQELEDYFAAADANPSPNEDTLLEGELQRLSADVAAEQRFSQLHQLQQDLLVEERARPVRRVHTLRSFSSGRILLPNREAFESALYSKLQKEEDSVGIGGTLGGIPGDVMMAKIVPLLEAQDLLRLAMTCTHFAPSIPTRTGRRAALVPEVGATLVPEIIFDPATISRRTRFGKAIKVSDAFHATPLSAKEFAHFHLPYLLERSARFRDWYYSLPEEEHDRLQEIHDLVHEQGYICLMPEWMVKELGSPVAREEPETECYFSTDANGCLHKHLDKSRNRVNFLVLDKAQVDASSPREVTMCKKGPGAKKGDWHQHFGAAEIPVPVKEAYLVLDAHGPEPLFVCYFRDGKFLDDVVAWLNGFEGIDVV